MYKQQPCIISYHNEHHVYNNDPFVYMCSTEEHNTHVSVYILHHSYSIQII